MEGLPQETLGLSTQQALRTLRADIALLLKQHDSNNVSKFRFLQDIVSISSEKVLLSGVAYTITFLYIVCLILTYIVGESHQENAYVLLEAGFLSAILLANLALAIHEDGLRRREMPNRVRHVLKLLDKAEKESSWLEENYPHLCAPFSPCVTLQWTYRDGRLVNLPWALLVRDDVVVVRPGQELPGLCAPLREERVTQQQKFEKISIPTIRKPHENKAYRMLETPYLANMKMALQEAQNRPNTVHNKLRYLVTVRLMEGVILPLVISLVVVASVFRHVYSVPGTQHSMWTEIYLLNIVAATLPLLQIVFPLAWVLLNCYGLARFKLLSETKEHRGRAKSCSLSEDAGDPLLQVLSESSEKQDRALLARTFFSILTGKEDMVTRTANIVHVLGALSALCCVDKKGILSWPNPTAEKVFFLRNPDAVSRSASDASTDYSDQQNNNKKQKQQTGVAAATTIAEVLDVTHSQNAPFSVEFDDQAWRQHLAALKPLGLAALLNTCAPAPRHTYSHLCAHLVCEAQLSEDLVPVTNRRCLCELAKQIGFQDEATRLYDVRESLAVFRHLQADTIRRETRFARSLHLNTKVKVPLPHMLSTIVTDPFKRLQLLSQGTADIVLETCADYWDGSDLAPLSASDRKKILDFYQRSSLTAYCTAFAYKPLTRSIDHKLASWYLELPADCKHLYPSCGQHPAAANNLFHSSDSLLLNFEKEDDASDANGFFDLESNQVFLGMVTMQYQAQSDMVELVERLEKACIRFVHFSKENELRSRVFSEKMGLESGWNCHISLMSDPPLSKPASPAASQSLPRGVGADRRPVASLVLADQCLSVPYSYSGMETCKPLSMSAPGAINVELSTVKFENESKRTRHSIPANNNKEDSTLPDYCLPSADSLEEVGSGEEDSPMDACRSLSCLTDSTDRSAPLNFDTSNRAKLPRGIENIRPHIEKVDNVPLLVSLFTDCTAATARDMIRVMQDYGEVVCVIGSAANRDNMRIFMQADASIAVEPLYPVLCQKLSPYVTPADCIGPIDLARSLNAISCSISSVRDADMSLLSLVTMSRHLITCLWNATQFWMCCVCTISFIQVCSLVGALPLCLSVGGAVWMSAVVVPALSCVLVCAPLDRTIMNSAAVHARHPADLHSQMMVYVLWCYGLKFIPAALSILVLYAATLRSFCQQISEWDASVSCYLVYPVSSRNATSPGGSGTAGAGAGAGAQDYSDGYYLAQHVALILLTVHLIVISVSFVDRNHSVWSKAFLVNKVWCVAIFVVLCAQGLFSWCLLQAHSPCPPRYAVPYQLLVCYAASPLLVFAINELIKWQEIKANLRYKRRACLDFGTKLGMNSPFN